MPAMREGFCHYGAENRLSPLPCGWHGPGRDTREQIQVSPMRQGLYVDPRAYRRRTSRSCASAG